MVWIEGSCPEQSRACYQDGFVTQRSCTTCQSAAVAIVHTAQDHCLQAATSTFSSHSCRASSLVKASPPTGGNRQTVIPNPLIFRLVTNGPSVSLLTTKPLCSKSLIVSSANLARTSSLVLPRELSKMTTSLSLAPDGKEAEKGMNARSESEMSRRRSSICDVRASGVGTGLS